MMRKLFVDFIPHLLLLPVLCSGFQSQLLEPGIVETTVPLPHPSDGGAVDVEEFVGFVHSAYGGTNIKLTVKCVDDNINYDYMAQFIVRSSPCDKEFYDVMASKDNRDWLNLYFTNEKAVPSPFNYQEILYYKSESKKLNCLDSGTKVWEETQGAKMERVKLEQPSKKGGGKTKRKAQQTQINGTIPTTPGTTPVVMEDDKSLNTKEKTLTLPVDAMYLVVVKLSVTNTPMTVGQKHNVSVEVRWKGPQGYLGAVDWPLLPFYGTMCGVYGVFALAWLIVSACQWKDLLRVQFWIGAVILLGMLEKAVFYAECQSLNSTGLSVEGAIQFAELVSCLKRTLARMLVIVVSVGFGVVKPRLGSTLHKVVGVGFVYFILCAIEGIMRVSKAQPEAVKQKQLAGLPLTLLEVAIFWWIFSSLVSTMRALRLRRNEVKLSLYRHFTNTLIFAVLASLAFMVWSLFMHVFTSCLRDWKELWVDTAFWHLLFSVILLVIMILWRPTNNNQRYAFTPLLDAEEDEDDDDTLFSEAFTTAEATKLRGLNSTTKAENRRDRSKELEASLEEELKWVEEHIPSSLADKALPALVDSDEEAQQAKFEISKMQ